MSDWTSAWRDSGIDIPESDEVERAAREPTDAQYAAGLRGLAEDERLSKGQSRMLRGAAQRLEARGKISEAAIQKAALAAAIACGCGVTVEEARMICHDPRVPSEIWSETCDCLTCARAALEAALEAALSGKEE